MRLLFAQAKPRILTLVLAGLLILAGSSLAVADNIVRGFLAQGKLRTGEVVALSATTDTIVRAAPALQPTLIYGVVVIPASAPVTLSNPADQVYVATEGTYPVLVNTANGPIQKGDYIALSSYDGIAAKATANQSTIIGRASASFDGTRNVVEHTGVWPVGLVATSLDVTRNPLFKNSLQIPAPLQKIGNSIAGREVPPFKVYTALILFVIATAVTVVLLVTGARGAMVAIGRNPLSRHVILRGLFEIAGAAVLIFLGGLFTVYLLLRL